MRLLAECILKSYKGVDGGVELPYGCRKECPQVRSTNEDSPGFYEDDIDNDISSHRSLCLSTHEYLQMSPWHL